MSAVVLLLCYLMGAVPIGLIVGKVARGIDIRDYGSGNIGASNVLRLLGPGPAAVVFVGDIVKGLIAVLICKAVFDAPYMAIVGGMLSILGHNFSVFLRFQGGKGVATSLGVVIGIHPPIAAIAFGMWLVLVGVFRYISIASIIASASVPIQMWLSGALLRKPVPGPYMAFGIIAAFFILVKHRSNIARLRAGTEHRVGQKLSTTSVSAREEEEKTP